MYVPRTRVMVLLMPMSECLVGERTKSRVREGNSQAHGAIWDGKGTNFTLYSANATKVEVCLFDSAGGSELERLALPEYTDQIWHGYIPDVGPSSLSDLTVLSQ